MSLADDISMHEQWRSRCRLHDESQPCQYCAYLRETTQTAANNMFERTKQAIDDLRRGPISISLTESDKKLLASMHISWDDV